MKKSAYVIPAVVAVVAELLIICLSLIVIALQNVLIPLMNPSMGGFVTISGSMSKLVFPPGMIFTFVYLLFYVIYLVAAIFYGGGNRRIIGGIIIGAFILLGIVSGIGGILLSGVGYRLMPGGLSSVNAAKLSYVNALVSYVSLLPGLFTSSMFFISVGRFGITDPDMMD